MYGSYLYESYSLGREDEIIKRKFKYIAVFANIRRETRGTMGNVENGT